MIDRATTVLTPGWGCDGRNCFNVTNDVPGLSTRESLERAGWLVLHVRGEVVRAFCPDCRQGRGFRPHHQPIGDSDVQVRKA